MMMTASTNTQERPATTKESTNTLGANQSQTEKPDLLEQTPNNVSLAKLLYDKLSLETDIEDAQGEITDEQDLIWRNQELKIKDKVDAYGYVLTEMHAELAKIKELKREASARISTAQARVLSNIARLKLRLNFLSEDRALRGHIYSFLPYLSIRREIEDISLVEDDQINLTIEIKEANWKELLSSVDNVPEFTILKRGAKVSQLPEDHPAVTTKRTASVRMT